MTTTEYVVTIACISGFFLTTVIGLLWLLSLYVRPRYEETTEQGQPLPPVYPRTGP